MKNTQLSNDLQKWKEKATNLEEQIVVIKKRFVEREIQYRKIIQELQDQLKSKSSLDTSDRNRMQNINQLHKEILDNIGTIQKKTSKILVQQESDIRRFFHKKINEIKEKFKEDKINKSQKDQQYMQKEKQMMSQLEWIKNIAQKIDLQNQTIIKKYSTLKSEFDIQQKDKDILLKELLMKKKQNAVLKSQVEQYEKLLNQVSRQMQDDGLSNSQLQNSQAKSNKGIQKKFKEMQRKDLKESQLYDSGLNKKYQSTVNHLNNVIAKERKKVRELKNLYMKQINSKSQLQKIIRKLVEDVRQSVIEVQKERNNNRKKKKDEDFDINAREQLLERILANQKILTLIYDKTFYAGQRPYSQMQQIPKQLAQIMEGSEDEGFH